MVHLCNPGFFFSFSKFWFFRWGVKGQKTVQNDKKLCLSLFISQEPYIIWLSFMVHMCKMIISHTLHHTRYLRNHTSCSCHFWYKCENDNISRSCFHFFKILIFWFVRWVKGQKTVQNDKNFVCHTLHLRNHTSYDCHLWYTCVK